MSDTAAASAGELKYRGVRKRKWGKYVAEIRLPNSRDRIWLGSYDAAEKAARAFDVALFCLRGRTANFNFSHDPPDIAGAQSLSRLEIQEVAQRYGNSYGGGRQQAAAAAAADGGDQAVEEEATVSPGYDGPGHVDLIDRSFWEMVDINGGGAAAECNAGWVSDFGPFSEPGEMLVYPDYEASVYEDEEECYYHRLWNF